MEINRSDRVSRSSCSKSLERAANPAVAAQIDAERDGHLAAIAR